MKHFLPALFFFFAGFALNAQTYYPFPDSGAVWTTVFEYQSTATNYSGAFDSYQLLGDTVIGSYTYKKIATAGQVIGGIRNDTVSHRVYFSGVYRWNTYNDVKLYDFDLNVGDTAYYETGNYVWIMVNAIDSVIVQGQPRKRLLLSNMGGGEEWVEGIGSLNQPLEPLDFEFEWNNTVMCLQLANNTVVYQHGDFSTSCNTWHFYPSYCGLLGEAPLQQGNFSVKLIPNSENNAMVMLQHVAGPTTISIFDIAGKELFRKKETETSCFLDLTNFASGIYILRVVDNSGNTVSEKFIRQ